MIVIIIMYYYTDYHHHIIIIITDTIMQAEPSGWDFKPTQHSETAVTVQSHAIVLLVNDEQCLCWCTWPCWCTWLLLVAVMGVFSILGEEVYITSFYHFLEATG